MSELLPEPARPGRGFTTSGQRVRPGGLLDFPLASPFAWAATLSFPLWRICFHNPRTTTTRTARQLQVDACLTPRGFRNHGTPFVSPAARVLICGRTASAQV